MEKENGRPLSEIGQQPERSRVSDALHEMTEFLKGEFPGIDTPGEDIVLDEESNENSNLPPAHETKQ